VLGAPDGQNARVLCLLITTILMGRSFLHHHGKGRNLFPNAVRGRCLPDLFRSCRCVPERFPGSFGSSRLNRFRRDLGRDFCLFRGFQSVALNANAIFLSSARQYLATPEKRPSRQSTISFDSTLTGTLIRMHAPEREVSSILTESSRAVPFRSLQATLATAIMTVLRSVRTPPISRLTSAKSQGTPLRILPARRPQHSPRRPSKRLACGRL
jgi:hypothetical protein